VPKSTCTGGRTSAFGLINKPTYELTKQLRNVFSDIRHHRCLADNSATRVYPVKRLRNNLISAMHVDVATQPVAAVVRHKEPNTLRRGKHAKQTIVWNPIWDVAPKGAFYKSRKVCSLITDIVMNGSKANIAHLVGRLAINIWRMSKRHFNGLVKSIRARIAQSVESDKIRKSPEALKRIEALIKNPYPQQVRGKRFSRNRICQHKAEFAALRLSTQVESVRESLKCTKCTVPAWLTNGLLHKAVWPD